MSKHQYAMVMDLNKCLGCQTCTIACKKLWTDRDGTGYMYWNNVETRPGLGYPRQWDRIGGGWKDGMLQPSPLPTMDDYGHPWEYDYEQRLFEGKRKPVMPSPEPKSGVNWDEDVGSMNGDGKLLLLRASHLQPLHLSGVSGSLPAQGHLQARGRWHRGH